MEITIHHDNRIYHASFISSALLNSETLSVKILMYNTEYTLLKNKATNTWSNAEFNKLKLSQALLEAAGPVIDEFMQKEARA